VHYYEGFNEQGMSTITKLQATKLGPLDHVPWNMSICRCSVMVNPLTPQFTAAESDFPVICYLTSNLHHLECNISNLNLLNEPLNNIGVYIILERNP